MAYGDYDPRHDGPVFNSVDEYRKYEEEEKRKRNAQTCGVMLLVWLLLPILILVGKKKNVNPKLIEEAKEHGVKVIFVAPQFPTKAANLVAKETGSKVVMIDQLPENWLAEMKKTAEIFAKSL